MMLLQDADDLLFGETATPQALVLELGQSELQTGLVPRGNVTPNPSPSSGPSRPRPSSPSSDGCLHHPTEA